MPRLPEEVQGARHLSPLRRKASRVPEKLGEVVRIIFLLALTQFCFWVGYWCAKTKPTEVYGPFDIRMPSSSFADVKVEGSGGWGGRKDHSQIEWGWVKGKKSEE